MSERECAMICVDNSEWMRNGDLVPTRLQCQQDAVNLVMQCKLRANPENGVGLLSMADQVQVLSTMSREERKLFIKLHEVQIKGSAQILNSIKVAHLALRHRQNRNHKMRIVMFVGSPIEEMDRVEFIKLAKKLKKEKVNVDFVCFGEATSDDNQILADFVETLNGKENTNSNILVVSAGSKLIEALVTSAICRGEAGSMAMVGANGAVEFGIDADEDPELALALRVSLEEQRQRQRQEAGAEAGAGAENDTAMEVQDAPAADGGGEQPAAVQSVEAPAADADGAVNLAAMTEEEQLAWALSMSMAESTGGQEQQAAVGGQTPTVAEPPAEETMEVDEGVGQLLEDPEMLQQLVDVIFEKEKPEGSGGGGVEKKPTDSDTDTNKDKATKDEDKP